MVSRRALLAGLGVVTLSAVSGCLGGSGPARPAGEPNSVPERYACTRDGFERHPAGYSDGDVELGSAGGFSLSANGRAFEYGDVLELTLRYGNLGSEIVGSEEKYNVELRTESGWVDVRGSGGTIAYTDLGHEKWTGQGWDWRIPLTESGIAEASSLAVSVCPALVTGRYRFVYWGVDTAVAVVFDLRVDG